MTYTPLPTFTPRPTATPIRVLEAPFVLKEQREICDASIPAGVMQVYVTGSDGEPLPGVRILVTWQNGEDSFYTGLAPEIGMGFADFRMTPGIEYSLKVGDASEPVSGLSTDETCGWKLEFTQEEGE